MGLTKQAIEVLHETEQYSNCQHPKPTFHAGR
jgi:hypothetical protein